MYPGVQLLDTPSNNELATIFPTGLYGRLFNGGTLETSFSRVLESPTIIPIYENKWRAREFRTATQPLLVLYSSMFNELTQYNEFSLVC
jgi:hypothetical protein